MDKLSKAIQETIRKQPGKVDGYKDLLSHLINTEDQQGANELRVLMLRNMPKAENIKEYFKVYDDCLLYCARDNFDAYLLYLEGNRPPNERFYLPRRKIMKQLVDALQDLYDDKLDELFLSMPPRVGKTSILMFFVTWLLGKDSEKSNLYSAFSDIITKAFFNGVLEIINDTVTYRWNKVFPDRKIVQTNAQDETLNVDRRKRYPSLTCRSLYGTLNGACDCNGFLISDDLIGGIEEALNKDRMISAWSKVDNNLIPRSKEKAKILWCGTRWSIVDPAGLRMDLLENDLRFKNRRYKIINLPALNSKDESNFHYDYNVGFSTDYYHQRRASFERNNDMASWSAQYMGEPIEREGTLFTPNEFRYYNGVLPERVPDRIFMAVDPAFGGGDFVAAPICYQYDDDIYIVDVVYTDEPKNISQPLIVDAILKHNVAACQIETNKSTESYKESIDKMLRDKGIRINMTSKSAPTNKSKEQRIFDKAPEIRERMIFLESGKRNRPYDLYMQNVYGFKMFGKNKHDDAPDSLAMAMAMASNRSGEYVIFKRPF